MRIALVTNKSLWHKYWLVELYSKFDVCMIIHVEGKREPVTKKIKSKIFKFGFFYSIFKVLSVFYNYIVRSSFERSLKTISKKYFSEYERKYSDIPNDIIYTTDSINSENTIKIIKSKEIDVICNLGGDIFRKDIITSANLACLNFHSGISPFYNGNKTVFHAVSDFRPNFVGGTLMYMNERIDGGNILLHYLVPIYPSDTATDLFMKNIQGSVKLYTIILEHLKNGSLPKGVPQKRSLKYFRNIDWTIIDDLKLKYFEKSGQMKQYIRSEQIVTYLDGADSYTCNKTLLELLFKE